MDYVFDSYTDKTSIIVSIWAAMADIEFHGDVIFLKRKPGLPSRLLSHSFTHESIKKLL
jgi:hypothetical protein